MKRFCILLLAIVFIAGAPSCKKDSKRKIRKNHKQEVGASAHDLLSSEDYTKLVVEIQYMEGYRPSENSIDNLRNFLANRLHKTISVKYTSIPAQGKANYSLDEIRNIETTHRTAFTSGKEIAAYFLFLDGEYSGNQGNSKVLGIAYYNTSMVIFQKTITDNTGGFGEPSTDKIETVVLNHEFGHILGLVDLGSPMQSSHIDAAHGNHCTNENCLMYWEAETGNLLSNMIGNTSVPELDANCIADLQSNGGR